VGHLLCCAVLAPSPIQLICLGRCAPFASHLAILATLFNSLLEAGVLKPAPCNAAIRPRRNSFTVFLAQAADVRNECQPLSDKPEMTSLYQLLAELPPASTWVLSPSDRARRGWMRWWQREAERRGLRQLPYFLTLDEWMLRWWQDGRLLGRLPDECDVIDGRIEAVLWQQAARSLFGCTVSQAQRIGQESQQAWQLLQAHANEDAAAPCEHATQAWRAIADKVLGRLRAERHFTAAELAGHLRRRLIVLKDLLPAHLVLTPQFAPRPEVERLLGAIAALGVCKVHRPTSWLQTTSPAVVERCAFSDPMSEREAALSWAARRSEQGTGADGVPVVIVVPDLSSSVGAWRRSARSLDVDANFSFGLRLSRYPWAAAGFVAVSAAFEAEPLDELLAALDHPRWGWPVEWRLALIGAVRQALGRGVRALPLGELLRHANLPDLLARLGPSLAGDDAPYGGQSRRRWAEHYRQLISALTVTTVSPQPTTWQMQEALQSAIDTWTGLDDWLPAVAHADAHAELIAITDSEPFQPEGSLQPIHVIGLLESAGLPHSGLWFTGAGDSVLPERCRLNAFLDAGWQRRAGVGLASFVSARRRAEALVGQWQVLGDVCLASLAPPPDGTLIWSPLVAAWPEVHEAPAATLPLGRDDPGMEWVADEQGVQATAAGNAVSRASVRMLEAQAHCPRRGYALAHLRLETWPVPGDGVDPRVRGALLHAVLERYGRRRVSMTDSFRGAPQTLCGEIPGWIEEVFRSCAPMLSHLPAAVVEAERDRQRRLVERFLAEESKRSFRILAVEHSEEVRIGDLSVRVKIDRIDAVESEEGGERGDALLLIDYKSGAISLGPLDAERLTSPQLPVYALALTQEGESFDGRVLVDVAYQRVHDDELALVSYRDSAGARSAGAVMSLADKLPLWKSRLETLAREIVEAEASLAPADPRSTCSGCEVRSFCGLDRVLLAQERTAALAESGMPMTSEDEA